MRFLNPHSHWHSNAHPLGHPRRTACLALLAGAATVLSPAVRAQQAGAASPRPAAPLPDGPLKIVVGYAPGGASDRAARLLADSLKDILGVPVIVENKTGAGGRLSAQQVKAAGPDQNVLLAGNPAINVVAPLVAANVGYDPMRLILDHVYDHEAAQPDRVFLTQPVGGGQVVDYTWAQTLDQARRMAAHLQSLQAAAGCTHRDAGQEQRALLHGRTGDLDGRRHHGGDLPDRDGRQHRLCAAKHSEASLLFIGKLDTWDLQKGGIPAACPASRCRWHRMWGATPGTPSSRAPPPLQGPRAARAPTTWRCCCTRPAPPASPRA
jgi:hypothetical protein